MIRDLKVYLLSSMISSVDVESEDSSLNRQVSINLPCSIRHFPRVLSPWSGGSSIHVPSARYTVWCRGLCHVPTNSRDKIASSGSASAITGTRKAATKQALDIRTNLLNGAVMLSEALQRNAKHKARLSNIDDLSAAIVPEIIRDSSLRSE